MAGEPALRKVADRLHSWLDGNIGTGVGLHLERPFDQPYQDSELPAVNIRLPNVAYSHSNYTGGFLHDAEVLFDIAVPSAALASIGADQAEIAADIVARMAGRTATAGTIGELLQDCYPVALTQPEDEYVLADHGVATFAWRMTWLTPQDDFRTIAGALGLVL